jgi:hypothetical protein
MFVKSDRNKGCSVSIPALGSACNQLNIYRRVKCFNVQESQMGLKLNETYQLLVNADDGILLRDN